MIQNKNIEIRLFEDEDYSEISKWSSNIEIKEQMCFDLIEQNLLENCIGRDFDFIKQNEDIYLFTIVLKDMDKPIGQCFIYDVDYINRSAKCSIYIGEEENRNNGYGCFSISKIIEYAFIKLNLNRISLWVFDFNKRAIKCFKKCGMKVEGIMREGLYRNGKYHDVYLMGILKSEYESSIKGV